MVYPFRQESLATLRRRVGYLMFGGKSEFQTATASAGTSSTVTLDFVKRFGPDALVGRTVYIVSGTGAGQRRAINDSDPTAGTLTVTPGWTTPPDGTSVCEVWPDYLAPEDVNAALNQAILRASDWLNTLVVQANPTLDATRKIITLPASWVKFVDVGYFYQGLWWEYLPQDFYDPMRGRTFVLRSPGKVYLSEAIPSAVPGADIQIRGYALPAALASDADLAEVPAAFLVPYAAFLLDASEAAGPTLDPEQHSGRAANWLREALAVEGRMATRWLPNTQEVP
jgi:hypothetical protein